MQIYLLFRPLLTQTLENKTIQMSQIQPYFFFWIKHIATQKRNSPDLSFQMTLQRNCNVKAAEQNPAFAERINRRAGLIIILKHKPQSYPMETELHRWGFVCPVLTKRQDKIHLLLWIAPLKSSLPDMSSEV